MLCGFVREPALRASAVSNSKSSKGVITMKRNRQKGNWQEGVDGEMGASEELEEHEPTPAELAELVALSLSGLTKICPYLIGMLEQVAWGFRQIHRDFGNWENFLANVPEALQDELRDLAERVQEGPLNDVSAFGGVAKLFIERFIGGEEFMARFKFLDEFPPPVDTRFRH
jgi:hypothetical protein